METPRVVITAAGIISPLGAGWEATVSALKEGRDCVSAVTAFDCSRTRSKTAGQIDPAWLPECTTRRSKRLHMASRIMIAATKEALDADPGFAPELMVIGTTSGGMGFGEQFYRSQINKTPTRNSAAWIANYLPAKAVSDAQEACGLSVPSQIIANACASGTNAVGHAFGLIRAGKHKRVLCGGYDAISELVFVGFDSLQASTPDRIRPFDKNRTGLVLGEGAAVLALEEMGSAIARGADILGEVTGYGISTDNHHLTQPHPSGIGALQAMQRALASAGLEPSAIDYINAHGTATPFNDSTEGIAISQLFGPKTVPVSSTKSMMGHSLGAAGAVEAVFSLMAIRDGFFPPNINYVEADPAWEIDVIANHAREGRVRRVLSNSFGFGGTNASVVIEEVRQ